MWPLQPILFTNQRSDVKRTGLARKNLLDRPARTIVSSVGVGFAILLMFMQLGFLGAVGDTATRVYSRLSCDLIIRSPEYLQVFDPRSVPMPLMPSIAAVSDVRDVRMIDLGVSGWRNPTTGELRPVAMIGIDPIGHRFKWLSSINWHRNCIAAIK